MICRYNTDPIEALFSSWSYGSPRVRAEQLRDFELTAAVQAIERRCASPGQGITAEHARRAQVALDSYQGRTGAAIPTRWRDLTAAEHAVLGRALPELQARLRLPSLLTSSAAARDSVDGSAEAAAGAGGASAAEGPGGSSLAADELAPDITVVEPNLPPPDLAELLPFCTALAPGAIPNPVYRRCAEIAGKLGDNRNGDLGVSGLMAAIDALDRQRRGEPLPPKVAEVLAEELKTDADRAAFTEINLERLRLFMETGLGRLLHAGPVIINGRPFDEVHRLPIVSQDPNVLAKALADYEERFANCGYDRIYIIDEDNQLLVALNPSGSLGNIAARMRAQVTDPVTGAFDRSGTVLPPADIYNSLYEGTLGFWADLPSNVTNLVRKFTGDSMSDRVKKAVGDIGNVPLPLKLENGPGTNPWWLAGGVGAAFGTVALTMPTLAGILLALGLAATAINVGVATNNIVRRDKTAIYHAVGVTVARPGPILY